jgi:hypothetical protein
MKYRSKNQKRDFLNKPLIRKGIKTLSRQDQVVKDGNFQYFTSFRDILWKLNIRSTGLGIPGRVIVGKNQRTGKAFKGYREN